LCSLCGCKAAEAWSWPSPTSVVVENEWSCAFSASCSISLQSPVAIGQQEALFASGGYCYKHWCEGNGGMPGGGLVSVVSLYVVSRNLQQRSK
jgi:hypothetical protein